MMSIIPHWRLILTNSDTGLMAAKNLYFLAMLIYIFDTKYIRYPSLYSAFYANRKAFNKFVYMNKF